MALKNIYSKEFFNNLSDCLGEVVPNFNKTVFLNQIFSTEWDKMELKQRMRHIALVLGDFFPKKFHKSARYIKLLINKLEQKGFKETSIEFMFLPDFIEIYGINDFDTSIALIETVTQFTSCEFAVRPFIIKHQNEMLKQMLDWSNHKNHKVRRLASEGCRPRLPWAMTIPSLKKNPVPIISILENLKNDDSEYVRRSVANNLNDISKDNPQTVIDLVKKWKGKTKETDALTKHASRTLLKQGNSELMELFGFGAIDKIKIIDFRLLTPIVKVGKYLEFSFQLINTDKENSTIRLEYGVYYQKANGSLSKKVFKITEKKYLTKSTSIINRKQSFKIITTRKFHLGKHQVSLIVNGKEFEKIDFKLTE
ncbi:DNA alkylation repair protein [Pontimicrobium sp. SW4]|uniref:DNA alkylation repair protein n=1 Tax=Pontimicrobium sp. SW4 TaxID=3153519 RepID=A0AAU7BUM9_9FLAO